MQVPGGPRQLPAPERAVQAPSTFWQHLLATSTERRLQAGFRDLPDSTGRTAVAAALERYLNATTWPDGTRLSALHQRVANRRPRPYEPWIDGKEAPAAIRRFKWCHRFVHHILLPLFVGNMLTFVCIMLVARASWLKLVAIPMLFVNSVVLIGVTGWILSPQESSVFCHVQMLHLLYVADTLRKHHQETGAAVPHPLLTHSAHVMGLRTTHTPKGVFRRGVEFDVPEQEQVDGMNMCFHEVQDDGSIRIHLWKPKQRNRDMW